SAFRSSQSGFSTEIRHSTFHRQPHAIDNGHSERNEPTMDIGLTLPNRGVLLGATTPDQMLDLAEAADRSGLFRSVWVGDSLLGKPRMESVSLLAGIAARTRRVRLGAACMARFRL